MEDPRPNLKRARIQEGSDWTGGTERSAERKVQRVLELAQFLPYPRMRHIAANCKERREAIKHHFNDNFTSWDDAVKKLSDPNTWIELPFPFAGFIAPKTFNRIGGPTTHYRYMGREIFSPFLDAFAKAKEWGSCDSLSVYGLMGSGKSYLLATLVYLLTAQGYRVVYLPDARLLLDNQVAYMKSSMLLAWADQSHKIEEIIRLQTAEQIEEFIEANWNANLIFVIDQLNALEGGARADKKGAINAWLSRCWFGSMVIRSTSAGHESFPETQDKQTTSYVFKVHDGFTEVRFLRLFQGHSNHKAE